MGDRANGTRLYSLVEHVLVVIDWEAVAEAKIESLIIKESTRQS